jgi:hypothetical protein
MTFRSWHFPGHPFLGSPEWSPGRLTGSAARTNMALFIHRAVRPARSSRRASVSAASRRHS